MNLVIISSFVHNPTVNVFFVAIISFWSSSLCSSFLSYVGIKALYFSDREWALKDSVIVLRNRNFITSLLFRCLICSENPHIILCDDVVLGANGPVS